MIREVEGLELLRQTVNDSSISELSIPKVISVSESRLELESIKQAPASRELMETLGRGLAKLHRVRFDSFGFEHDNYIGLNPQLNGIDKNWGQFFIRQRLAAQLELINDTKIRTEFQTLLEDSQSKLEDFLNEQGIYPSLVHGDLWSGNVIFDEQRAWIIDPAVYFADREVDIAMTEMFGGFDPQFYQAYQEVYPLSAQYPIKRDIYNLYHFLNHFNLFGSAYLAPCRKAFQLIQNL